MQDNPYQLQIDDLKSKIAKNQALLEDPELGELAQEEVKNLQSQLTMLEDALDQMGGDAETSADPQDVTKTNCLIEFRQGTGGDEAKLWAGELMRMYSRFAEQIGLKIEYVDEMVVKIKGRTSQFADLFPYEIFKYESGVHRVQRIPVTESQGRIHTSTASVAVLPEVGKSAVEVKDDDLEWQFMRSGGAGGQSVNKTSSAVRLTHRPSGIIVTARQERKQAQNREIALDLLRAQLWEVEEEKRLSQLGDARSAIGTAKRSEKIRTYNFPQNRVTDHRTKQSWYDLETILAGNLSKMISELRLEIEGEVEN